LAFRQPRGPTFRRVREAPMSTEENKELLRRGYMAWATFDEETFVACTAPTWRDLDGAGNELDDRDNAVANMRRHRVAFPDQRLEFHDILGEGELVASFCTLTATHRQVLRRGANWSRSSKSLPRHPSRRRWSGRGESDDVRRSRVPCPTQTLTASVVASRRSRTRPSPAHGDRGTTELKEGNGSRLAALHRTLAGSGRNAQGTAAPVHLFRCRDATPVEPRSQQPVAHGVRVADPVDGPLGCSSVSVGKKIGDDARGVRHRLRMSWLRQRG
jgi:hypothetical protein